MQHPGAVVHLSDNPMDSSKVSSVYMCYALQGYTNVKDRHVRIRPVNLIFMNCPRERESRQLGQSNYNFV